ncbi:MAG: hypothetical protein ABH857_01485 [Elusimicrobiota bacterium]
MKIKLCYLIFLFLLFFQNLLFAGIKIIPVKQELSLSQGQSFRSTMSISRASESDFEAVKVETKKWFELKENKNIEINDWLKFDESEIVFKEGELSRLLSYTVSVPTNAVSEIMAMVSFTPIEKNQSQITQVFSVPIYVFIKDTGRLAGEIAQFEAVKQKTGAIQCVLQIKNTGNIHFRPVGSFKIFKGKKEIEAFEMKSGRPVYPDKTRTFVGYGEQQLNDGFYKILIETYYNNNKQEILHKKTYKLQVKGDLVKVK